MLEIRSHITTKVHVVGYENTDSKIIYFLSKMVIPSFQVVAEIINQFNLIDMQVSEAQLEKEIFKRGGSGEVIFINGYAIKRSFDKYGNDAYRNQALRLARASASINHMRPAGFALNLPLNIFRIYDTKYQQFALCNLQVGKMVKCLDEHRKTLADILKLYIESPVGVCSENNLSIIQSLGKRLAQFQQSNLSKNCYGLQHGDFNPNNILITKVSSIHEDKNEEDGFFFTLIDNADFSERGALILDPMYFIFFSTLLSKKTNQNFAHVDKEYINKYAHIINRFYLGYVSHLQFAVKETMKRTIFDQGSPLENACQEKYRYFFNCGPGWSTYLEIMQREAFMKAYTIDQPVGLVPRFIETLPRQQEVHPKQRMRTPLKHALEQNVYSATQSIPHASIRQATEGNLIWAAPSLSRFKKFGIEKYKDHIVFSAYFTPLDQKVRKCLKNYHLQFSIIKFATSKGIYSTTNPESQLHLLELAVNEQAIPQDDIEKVRNLIYR